ncbi:MAG: hypothetical protein E7447_04815 [Ruminococcaceae bacterium]|nr:hypothetical protein [Oscillospiraceae bacterium]
MKKFKYILALLSTLLLVVLVLNLAGAVRYSWKTVKTGDFGSFRVPESWDISIIDEYTYISLNKNGESKNILIQYASGGYTNPYFDDIEELVWLQDEWFSNGAGMINYEIHYKNGSTAQIWALEFWGLDAQFITYFCLDDSLSEYTLKKIVNSFGP